MVVDKSGGEEVGREGGEGGRGWMVEKCVQQSHDSRAKCVEN